MSTLRRHDLVWPDTRGWAALRPADGVAFDALASDCLAHWARAGLPLVVTRQAPVDDSSVALGLAAPARWGRRRIALRLAADDRIARVGGFPLALTVDALLAPAVRPAWRALVGQLDGLAAAPTRVYGSHGWEVLSGERCLRDGSDLDLLLEARDAAGADAICSVLAAADFAGPRLDGELRIGGVDIAWREWQRSRRTTGERVLAKRLEGVALVRATTDRA